MKTALVLPVFNEAENLEPLVNRLASVRSSAGLDLDLLVVDDGSRDSSPSRLEQLAGLYPYLQVLTHASNRGFAAALATGRLHALQSGYQAAAFMDADLTHEPEALPRLIDALEQGADLAIGSRYVPGGGVEGVPLMRRLISRAGNRLGRALLRLPVRDMTSGYRAYRVEALKALRLEEQGFGIQLEAVVKAHRAGLKLVEVPITLRVRGSGHSKMVYNLPFWLSYLRLFWRCLRWSA